MKKALWRWLDSGSMEASIQASMPATLKDSMDNSHPALPQPDRQIDWVRIIPFVFLHIACLSVLWVGVSTFAVVFMLAFYLLRMFAITGFYHRYFAHKTFETSRTLQFIFALIGSMSSQRGPLWWAAHHRHHHRHADQPQDKHSPQHGFWYSHMGWFLNRQNFVTDKQAVRDWWLKYPELVWLDRFNLPVVLLTAGFIYLLGEWLATYQPQLHTSGLQLLVWGFLISTILLTHATLMINSLAHRYGTRDFNTGDQSRNNLFLALITLGEGWHNNHHFYAGSVRQGFYWWQIDITYYILKVMSWVGLVWNLKPVPPRVYLARDTARSDV